MARVLNAITLNAPTTLVNQAVGTTFTFTGTPGFSGTGTVQRYDFKFEYSSNGGSTYNTMASSGTGLTTTSNPLTNQNGTTAISRTVTCAVSGSYLIRMSGAPTTGGAYSVTSSTQTVNVQTTYNILANDVQSTCSVTSPSCNAIDILLADDSQSTSEVTNPNIATYAYSITAFPEFISAIGWTSPGNATSSDDLYASYTISSANTTGNPNILGNYHFLATIPAGATINGVTLETKHRVSTQAGIATLRHIVEIPDVGTTVIDNSDEPIVSTVNIYPFVDRPGGGSWTLDDLDDGVFETKLKAVTGASSTPVTFYWDYVKVTVYYNTETALLANDVQSTSTVTVPILSGPLLADDVESASSLSSPAVHQGHILHTGEHPLEIDPDVAPTVPDGIASSNITSSSFVISWNPSSEVINHIVDPDTGYFIADPAYDDGIIQSASTASIPVLNAGVDGMFANDVQSATNLSPVHISQIHAILAADAQSLSQITNPTITQATPPAIPLIANDVESRSEVHLIQAIQVNSVQSLTSVTTVTITQVHAILADDVESLTEVFIPVPRGRDDLLAGDVECEIRTSRPVIHVYEGVVIYDESYTIWTTDQSNITDWSTDPSNQTDWAKVRQIA